MRKMATTTRLAAMAAVAMGTLVGCTGPLSVPGVDDTADFKAYHTYAYASESRLLPDAKAANGLPAYTAEQILRREIDRELTQRGWRQVPPSYGGDIVVAFGIGVPPRPNSRNFHPDYPWAGWIKADDRVLVHGDFIDRLSITLVDRMADKTVLYGYIAEPPPAGVDLELVLAQDVTKILAQLPPK
jgi:Domain of unknown function (DUF4136)